MSRNLKRVPLDFSWPLHERWRGYVNPYRKLAAKCPDCEDGYDRVNGRPDANATLFFAQWHGYATFDPIAYGAEPLSPFAPAIWRLASKNVGAPPDFYATHAERIAIQAAVWANKIRTRRAFSSEPPFIIFSTFDKARGINLEAHRLYELWRHNWEHHLIQADVDALVEHRRLPDFTHTWTQEHGWQKRADSYHPTATEVNAWSLEGMGHDAVNSGVCIEARCARENVPYTCLRCHGTGQAWPTPEIEQQYENWKPLGPPTGSGYQLWEDCSEGSPISPVFATLDDLCTWAADHATTFGPCKATFEEWKKMLDGGVVHAKVGGLIFL